MKRLMAGVALMFLAVASYAQTLPAPAQGIVNALTGSGNTPPAPAPVSVAPGDNPNPNREGDQAIAESDLCAALAADNRGKVTPALKAQARCS